MNSGLLQKVQAYCEDNRLVPDGGTIVIGVSGGADSMTLLHMLHRWPGLPLRLVAVHVHHGLRGEEADRDEAFVRQQCAALDVELRVFHADVRTLARQQHRGLEETGRRVRYQFFEQIRQECKGDCVATAHNADDQAETVLMHLIRGCGVQGLRGMAPRSGWVIRPLLTCTRQEIEEFCTAQNILYVQDSTNADPGYTRNRIRHQILPLLRQINPSVSGAISRLSVSATADDTCLERMSMEQLQTAYAGNGVYRTEAFLTADKAVCRRMLHRLTGKDASGRDSEETYVAALCNLLEKGSGCLSLPGGRTVRLDSHTLRMITDAAESFLPLPINLPASGRITINIGHQQYRLTILNELDCHNARNVHKMFFKNSLDYDKIQGSLIVRSRTEGDSFHPAGRQVGKTIKKIFNEIHLPAEQRDAYPLLCDEAGIVLVPGVAADERVRVSENTIHFLVWQALEEKS